MEAAATSGAGSGKGLRAGAAVAAALLLTGIALPAAGATSQENIYASGCTDDTVSLRCPPSHRIAINRLFYGVKRSWECETQATRKASCCHHGHTDCMISDDSDYPSFNTQCSGFRECKIKVKKAPAANHCPGAAHTDYLTVIYDCVPDVDVARFCSNDVKRGKVLYLANTEYPDTFKGDKSDCTCMVRTAGGAEGINIHSIDILLTWPVFDQGANRRTCYRELAIKDEKGYRWNIQCDSTGYHGFRTIFTRPAQNVTVTLTSTADKGSAFVWLQTRATHEEEQIEVYCGEPLRQILLRARQEAEARHRNRGDSADRTTVATDKGRTKNSTYPYSAPIGSLNSNLAAIVGGIVAAGIILISIVIIAIALHCRRVRQAKLKNKQAASLNLYPAVSNGEATNLTSYCRYNDYDDDHYSSINRSPLKMSSLTDSDHATNLARTNGFVTLATSAALEQRQRELTEREITGSEFRVVENVVPMAATRESEGNSGGERGIVGGGVVTGALVAQNAAPYSPQSPPHESPRSPSARDALLSDPAFSGHLSLRRAGGSGGGGQVLHTADVHDGHKTLPSGHYHHQQQQYHGYGKILVTGPKSPLGKRSKSVSFSQPVAMVTPLPSGSEESVEGNSGKNTGQPEEDVFMKGPSASSNSLEDGNYDNLNKIVVPDHPLSPSLIHHSLPYSPSHCQQPPPVLAAIDPRNNQFSSINYDSYHNQYNAALRSPQRAGTLPKSLSTFRSEEEERSALLSCQEADGDLDDLPMNLPPPPPPLPMALGGDTYAVVHKTVKRPLPLPVLHPQPQNAKLFETGV